VAAVHAARGTLQRKSAALLAAETEFQERFGVDSSLTLTSAASHRTQSDRARATAQARVRAQEQIASTTASLNEAIDQWNTDKAAVASNAKEARDAIAAEQELALHIERVQKRIKALDSGCDQQQDAVRATLDRIEAGVTRHQALLLAAHSSEAGAEKAGGVMAQVEAKLQAESGHALRLRNEMAEGRSGVVRALEIQSQSEQQFAAASASFRLLQESHTTVSGEIGSASSSVALKEQEMQQLEAEISRLRRAASTVENELVKLNGEELLGTDVVSRLMHSEQQRSVHPQPPTAAPIPLVAPSSYSRPSAGNGVDYF
jgi:chromosome segregation ATPase